MKHQLGLEAPLMAAVLRYREQVQDRQADLLAYLDPDSIIKAFRTENWPAQRVEDLREHVRKEALTRLALTGKDSLSGALAWTTNAIAKLITLELRVQAQIGPTFMQHSTIELLDEPEEQ